MQFQESINRENLHFLMHLFYTRAMKDPLLGPFFINELGDDINNQEWIEHIDLLADFWLAELAGKDTYVGNYIGAHIKVAHINRESFVIWLDLFAKTTDEIYTPEISQKFKQRGELLAQKFIARLKI